MADKETKSNRQSVKAADQYPGVAFDIVSDEKVSSQRVDADVKSLNDNPRNNDLDETPVK